jgi:hypothetical protein
MFDFVLVTETVPALGRLRQRRAPRVRAVGVQRAYQSHVRQVGDTAATAHTLGVFEEKELPAMVAVKDLHI